MAVHVDEMTSEVTAESGSATAGAPTPPNWQQTTSVRQMQAEIARNALRTAAEDYDD